MLKFILSYSIEESIFCVVLIAVFVPVFYFIFSVSSNIKSFNPIYWDYFFKCLFTVLVLYCTISLFIHVTNIIYKILNKL